jgi:hypothetical protein
VPEPKWCSRGELEASGLSKPAIDGLIRSGQVKSVFRGVLLPADAAGDLWQLCGAGLSTQHPDAVVSRRTSAVAHQFPWLPKEWPRSREICVDVPRACTRSSRRGLDRRWSATDPEDLVTWHGLRIHSVARTAVDLARDGDRDLVVPILDGLFTDGRCTREELNACLERMAGLPNIRRARGLVDLAREGGVASPRETHTRLRITDAGLPMPDVNLEITAGSRVIAQGDLGYWRWLIWIEYDGEEFHLERRFDGRDQNKDRWLGRRGWDVIRLTNGDYHRPAVFQSQLAAAIAEAPARIAAMDPARSPEVARARRLLGFD